MPHAAEPWPAPEEPPLAGVSSFGFGGTNCHVVLQASTPQPAHLIPLSAPDEASLRDVVRTVREAASGDVPLADLAWTAGDRLSHHPHRLALTARTREELLEQLDRWGASDFTGQSTPLSRPRVVFVFAGQGGQWVGMGRELMRCEPVFRGVVRECEVAFGEFVDWSLVGVLEGDEVAGIDVVQPVLFAVEVGLAALWRSWGVQPAAVVGHSMGEVAAAYVAGALSLSDAARVICSRSGLLRQVAGRGAMAVVELDAVAVDEVVAGFGGEVVMAAWNGPMTSVVAGSPQAVDAVVELLSGREVFARRVQVDVASHSPQVDGLRVDLLERLGQVAPRVGSVPLYSTVRGEVLAGDELDAGYWWENLREPVRFAPAVDRLLADGLTCFLEISPHPVLSSAVEQSCRRGGVGVVLPSTRRDSPERLSMLETAGTLYQLGVPIQWRALYPQDVKPVPLPMAPGAADATHAAAEAEPAALVPLSAHTPAALTELTRRTVDLLRRHPNVSLADLGHTAAVRRDHQAVRLAVAATSRPTWSRSWRPSSRRAASNPCARRPGSPCGVCVCGSGWAVGGDGAGVDAVRAGVSGGGARV